VYCGRSCWRGFLAVEGRRPIVTIIVVILFYFIEKHIDFINIKLMYNKLVHLHYSVLKNENKNLLQKNISKKNLPPYWRIIVFSFLNNI
jgi:hypothetical protein